MTLETPEARVRLAPSDIESADSLFARIERRAVRPLQTRLLNCFDQGEEVEFGDMSVSRRGIRVGEELKPWSSLKFVELSPTLIHLHWEGSRRTKRIT